MRPAHRGDFATAHRVAADPLETARGFEACGAELIHIVDLDGALKGERVNGAIIREIVEKTPSR